MAVHIGPVLAQQVLAGEDQRRRGALRCRRLGQAGQHGLGRMHVAVAVGLLDLLRHLAHVAALVGVGREGHRLAEQFEIAQPGRDGEDVHLAAGVIDVVLARHLVAGEGQQRRQAGAVGGAAAMADMQRAGGIGGNEFDLQGRIPAAWRGARNAHVVLWITLCAMCCRPHASAGSRSRFALQQAIKVFK
jgi:hypothetical protein